MEDSRFSHLLDILRDKTHILESVSINHNAIGPATCTSLLNIMKRVSPQWLKEFKLDHCPMSDSTQDILAKQITYMPQLRKLTLTRFSFSMESLKLFIQYLREADSLEEICLQYLSFRTYKTRMIIDIIAALAELQNIKSLDLSHNNLQPSHATLQPEHTDVDKKQQSLITDEDKNLISLLVNLMQRNTSLSCLKLSHCNLSSFTLKEIAPFIKTSEALNLVHLIGNTGSTDYEVLKFYQHLLNAPNSDGLGVE